MSWPFLKRIPYSDAHLLTRFPQFYLLPFAHIPCVHRLAMAAVTVMHEQVHQWAGKKDEIRQE